jgi:fructose-1,6-bisphosphatase/inositol monophosphatase family enzyme
MTDLGTALAVAIEAAREAGALLLQDFLKPGGPSGRGSHAVADEQAEWLIRRRLLAATPTWGYLGEETGRGEVGDGRHLWLVDPNEGTAAYLKGFRGSSVSIGLLRDGIPVLGVVFAYAAPDNGCFRSPWWINQHIGGQIPWRA